MRICILSRDNVPIGYLDNDVPDGMHYYDDKLHVYLTGTAHTFEFTARATEESAELLAVGNKLAFIYKERPYFLNIVTTSQDEDEIEVEAWAFCLELLNETANAYEGTSKTFMEYFSGMIFANDMFEIGINEVSTRKRTLSYTSTSDTLLKRLYSLVEAFGAEVEFIPELNPDYSLNKILVNVYQEHSDTVQGVGERRTDANYRYGKGVDGITKKQDITNLYTAIYPTGKDGLTITDMETAKVMDDDGNVLYIHSKGDGMIRAPQAMAQFPSYVGTKDKYISYNWETNYETQADLYGNALAKLKEISVPDSSYEIKGSIDVNIGDTITVIDESFSPALYLETRVTEQEISFTDSTRNSTTFESTKELESAIDSTLVKRVAELETQTAKISTKADEAVVKADSASETASSAATKADEASTTASKAQETAASAQTAATNAESKATQAASDASSAQASASSAQASASSAQASASSAQTQAETANTAAQASASSASTASAQATASAKSASEATAAANSSVVSSVTEYYLSTSATSQTGGSWSTTSPTWSEGTYVWTRTKTTTKGGTVSYSNAACVTGNTGAQGEQGIQGESGTGILKITTAPTSYTTKVGDFTPSYRLTLATVKTQASVTDVKVGDTLSYLYYLYKIGYIDDTYVYTAARTSIRGSTGNGIASITEHYAVSTSNTTEPTSWSSSIPTMTATDKYLWNYETVNYTNGTTADTTKRVIGVYGDTGAQGEQGYSVAQVTTMYYLSDSATAQSGGEWTTDMPEWKSGYYLWQKDVTLLSDGSTIMGTPALSNGINSANTNASTAVTTANTANSAANAAKTTATNAQTTANTAKTTADTAKTTADTAKAATDTLNTLIRETTDGVEVAKVDDTGAYTGMRTEQTADAYLIKDKDGNTLASYGADTVELGKGSDTSTIKMCNGTAEIKSTAKEGWASANSITFSDYGEIGVSSDTASGYFTVSDDSVSMGASVNDDATVRAGIGFGVNSLSKYSNINIYGDDFSLQSNDSPSSNLTAYARSVNDTVVSLWNGLGLDQCAFYHNYGINTATIGGSAWNNFTTTNISVTESELQAGTSSSEHANYLILCWARVLAVSGNGGALLRLYSGGKAIHSAETKFGSGAIFTNIWQTLTFSTIWYVGEQGVYNFNAYPQILASATYKVDSCTLMMIRLNDGFYSK
jgi:phage minor structural protein